MAGKQVNNNQVRRKNTPKKNTSKNQKKKKRQVECPYCGYTWEPRVAKPKQCPVCKRYLI